MHTEHKYNLERYDDDDDGNSNYNNDDNNNNNNNNNNNPIYDLTRPRPENRKDQQITK